MLIPITRAPLALVRTSICHLAPSATALISHMSGKPEPHQIDDPKDGAGLQPSHSGSDLAGPRRSERSVVRQFGLINADRIAGPALLRHIVLRHYLSACMPTSTGDLTPRESLREPYRSVIQSLQSRFVQAGLFKTQEDAVSVTFSDGAHQLQIVTDRDILPSETGRFIDRKGNVHCLRRLQRQFNPEAYLKEVGDLKNILDDYGVEL